MTYNKVKDDQWVQPISSTGFKMSCCDCGLVHNFDFRIYNGKIEFRARRNNRSTGQKRRHMLGVTVKK